MVEHEHIFFLRGLMRPEMLNLQKIVQSIVAVALTKIAVYIIFDVVG